MAWAGVLALAAGLLAPTASAQTRGGTLHAVAQPEPAAVMIAVNQQTSTTYVASKMFESLLTYSFDLKPLPSLPQSWKISDNGMVSTFNLQPKQDESNLGKASVIKLQCRGSPKN